MRPDRPDNICPVCDAQLLQSRTNRGRDAWFYSCPLCGNFGLTGTADTLVPVRLERKAEKIAIFSHSLRKMQQSAEWPMVTSDVAQKVIEEGTLPTPREQADNLVRWIGETTQEPGLMVSLDPRKHRSIVGAVSPNGLEFVVDGLREQALIKGGTHVVSGPDGVALTFNGWDRYEELRRGAPSGRVAFMAMQFGDAVLDRVLNEHFRPAVTQTGFTLRRLDDIPKAGLIDDRLRVEIQGARFLIVDLSHGNRGAYWEAGYAEGLGKPVIYTCEEAKFSEASHFDTNHHLTVMWTEATLTNAVKQLKATIRATIPEAKREDD